MQPLETIIPVLIRMQAALDADLSLSAMSTLAGLSPFHFHRLFRQQTGETLKAYTLRLRLERAAFRLLVHEATILEIALDCGFHNHETFTRAFRKHFAQSPSQYRAARRSRIDQAVDTAREILNDPQRRVELSRVRLTRFRETHLAFIRHVGPYEAVQDSLWAELVEWARRRGMNGPHMLLGIGHDAPSTTPSSLLRFDAAIRVESKFAPEGAIGHQTLPAGEFAMATHSGHYSTLPHAYAALFPQLFRWKGYEITGLPAVEIYHTTAVNQHYEMNHTGIHIPMRKITPGGESEPPE